MLRIRLTPEQYNEMGVVTSGCAGFYRYPDGSYTLNVCDILDQHVGAAVSCLVRFGRDIVVSYDPHIIQSELDTWQDAVKQLVRLSGLLGLR